uniref:Peroxisomal membrane protein 4 n=1 Tax=Hanusia phi TaxID=3032 RepID=A0A7S0HPF9_9CRYP
MHLIFKSQSPMKENFIAILKMSFVHARNLGAFVFIYKGLLSAARLLYQALGLHVATPPGAAARGWHALLAGWIGAQFVWANFSSVNEQICLYLLSRIILGLFKLMAKRGIYPLNKFNYQQVYPFLASAIWAIVMWIYEVEPKMLQPSLEASMRYLYTDSNSWARRETFLPSLASVVILGSIFWMKRRSMSDLWDLKKRV